jgi:pSer/pThr/pTyr-binding forkhead associated (FHA) protein
MKTVTIGRAADNDTVIDDKNVSRKHLQITFDGTTFRAVDENDLPIQLPEVDKFLPTETGEPPLGRAKEWEYEVSEPRFLQD